MLVLDASLVVELALDRHAALADEELVAPPLLWSEVASVLSELAFRGEISRQLADRAVRRFLGGELDVAERGTAGLGLEAFNVARRLGWAKTYDAEYVAVAKLLGCRLVTLDMPLRRGADRLGFVITPAELAASASENP